MPVLKRESANMYSKDSKADTINSRKTIDKKINKYINRKMKYFIEIGIMPEVLAACYKLYQLNSAADKKVLFSYLEL